MGHIYFQTYRAAEKVLVVIITSTTATRQRAGPGPTFAFQLLGASTLHPFTVHDPSIVSKEIYRGPSIETESFLFFSFFLWECVLAWGSSSVYMSIS
jgi:hypothetical protein